MKQILKWGIALAAIVLTGAVSYLVCQEYQAGKQREAEYAELQNRLLPLEQKKTEIRQRLNDWQKDYIQESQKKATVVVLFTDLDEDIYTVMYPKMKAKGYIGVVALPITQSLGQSGCLNQEQWHELREAGWQSCLKWEGGMDSEEWMERCEAMIQNLGTELPRTVYFSYGTYNKDMDEFLAGKGIAIAVHHGEEDMPLMLTEAGEGIWHPGSRGIQEQKTARLLSEVVEQRGNIIYTIGSDFQGENYDQVQFDGMLRWFDSYCKADEMMVTDVEGAREYFQRLENEEGKQRKGYEEEKRMLEEELEAVSGEIDGLLGR
ncbi:MAG: hypothetical protein HFG55_07925 [Lachnospiraceae bacterium]|nr:hypothetical protein [Lachnospiraceae bacterium]